MRSIRVFALAAVACLLVAGTLQAQTATGSVKWMGVNGARGSYNNSGSGSATWNVYTSPYRAAFQIPSNPAPGLLPPAGTSSFGPTWDIYCIDFNHYANTGTNAVFFTNLGDAQTHSGWLGTYTRSSSLQTYLAAAYLVEQIRAHPSDAGILNGAVWQIMSGQPNYWWNGTSWASVSGAASYALTTGWQSVEARHWAVVTDGGRDANGSPVLGNTQEYLTRAVVNSPEPVTLLLLSSGLVLMLMAAGAIRRPTV